MVVQPIPDPVLAELPEMSSVFEALIEYRQGREVITRCPKCDRLIVVTNLPEVGSLWVTCDTGCTSYHEKYQPKT